MVQTGITRATVRRLVDEFGQLRFDPTGERRRFGASASGERSCHASTASSWPGFATKPAGSILSSALGRVFINRQTSGDESPEPNLGAVAIVGEVSTCPKLPFQGQR